MRRACRKRFAYLAINNVAPVVIGEMGGFYDHATEADPTSKDKQWQDWAMKYMKDNGIGVFCARTSCLCDGHGALCMQCICG
jgi:hypothetical protein